MQHPLTRAALAAAFAMPLAAVLPAQNAPVFDAAQVILGPLDPAIEALFDLDGDPYPDAVGALFGTASSIVGVYQNDGSGHFTPVWSGPEAGWFGPSVILPGDFDGDGRRDDFVVSAANRVKIYRFDGVGAPIGVDDWPAPANGNMRDLEVRDLDHDGIDDVILLSTDQTGTPTLATVSTYLATGAGTPPTVHTTTFASLAVRTRTAACPDGSFVTMVMAGSPAQIVPVTIHANGTAFTVGASFTVTEYLTDPATGDIDQDGDEDIVLFGMPSSAGAYQVLRQTASGTFTVEASRPGGPATALADVDGDGDLDGICCGGGGGGPPLPNHRASNFEIAIFDPATGFAPSFMIAGSGARHIAGATDLDGDGDTDLIAGRALFRGNGPMTGAPFDTVPTPFQYPVAMLNALADGDGDGDVDIGFSPFGGYHNVDGHTFPILPTTSPIAQQWVNGVAIGDLDGDGDLDALLNISAFGSPPVTPGVWSVMQTSPGRFALGAYAFAPNPNALAPSYSFRSRIVDLDGDGFADLAITTDFPSGTSTNNDITSLYRGSAMGTFTYVGNLAVTIKAIADFDADGLPDLLVSQRTGTWGVQRNLGGVAFAAPVTLLSTAQVTYQDRPGVGDIDGDGDLDLALGEHRNSGVVGTCVLFVNDGHGTFNALPRQPGFPDFGSHGDRVLRLVDVDGDRVVDLLMYPGRDSYYATTIFTGNGDGTFAERSTEVLMPEYVADLDGDGATDVFRLYGGAILHARPDATTVRGAFEQRGTSGAGTGGIAMTLGAAGPFRIDDTIELRVRGARGGAAGALVIGTTGTFVPNALGAGQNLYVELFSAPTATVPVVLGGTPGAAGAGTLTVPVQIPATVLGVELHHQLAVIDPAAPMGAALSNGLRIRYGD